MEVGRRSGHTQLVCEAWILREWIPAQHVPLTFPSCWWTLRLYIITIPSRTSRREFSVMGWSGSSGGLPSKRPSFPWVPSTAMHSQNRKEDLSKEFWHLSFCLMLSEAKALLCLYNIKLLPSPWDSLDTTLPHHSHLAACIRLPVRSVQTDPSRANSTSSSPVHASEPCLVHPNSNSAAAAHIILWLVCLQSKWLQLPLNCLPARSHCIWRNQGSISLHAEGDNTTSVTFRMAKGSACPRNGKEQCWH